MGKPGAVGPRTCLFRAGVGEGSKEWVVFKSFPFSPRVLPCRQKGQLEEWLFLFGEDALSQKAVSGAKWKATEILQAEKSPKDANQ